MQVVDHERHRSLPGDVGRQPRQPVQHRELTAGLTLGARDEAENRARRSRVSSRNRRRSSGEAGRRQHRFEQLSDQPEPELPLQLHPACRLLQQARLPDLRLPLDDREHTSPPRRASEQPKLVLPLAEFRRVPHALRVYRALPWRGSPAPLRRLNLEALRSASCGGDEQ
ncbi:hypothetical protein MPTA5024_27740 [Microbispora sp. ATCC PTA-5024]|nr:hypothetical protein MPTA5024_27740 [Microbispora sp. ATCC PTA-5024]